MATLRRFWTMLAHTQGGLLNAAALAEGLGVSGQTVGRYLDLLVDLMLVRRLMPWHQNAGKRLVKSPKVFVRDSGLVHALLGLGTLESLLGHPVVGGSWEGFCLEALIGAAPFDYQLAMLGCGGTLPDDMPRYTEADLDRFGAEGYLCIAISYQDQQGPEAEALADLADEPNTD